MTRDGISLAKITTPEPPKGLVKRRLLAEIKTEARRADLVVVAASAGYGKTALLSGLARESGPAAWYSASPDDRDFDFFLAHLECSVARALGQAPPSGHRFSSLSLRRASHQPGSLAAVRLINWMAQELKAPLLLVIDDFHLLEGAAQVKAFLRTLLRYIPPALHVIRGSRNIPDIPFLFKWQASGRATVIREEQLRFDQSEAAALLSSTLGLQPDGETIARLLSITEGWPLGLHLVSRLLRERIGRRRGGFHDLLTSFLPELASRESIVAHDLNDYFREFLRSQPPLVREFLLEASVLDILSPSACDTILDRSDSGVILRRLERQGLFLVSVGSDAWRLHQLFRTYLQGELSAQRERYLALQQAAAEYFTAADSPEEAVPYWLDMGQYDRAAACVCSAAQRMVQSGRIPTLSHWLEQFPSKELERHPDLQYWKAYVLQVEGFWQQALSWYDRAEEGYRQTGNLRGQIEVNRQRTHIASWWERKPRKAEQYALTALRLLEQGPACETGDHFRDLARAHLTPGNMSVARQLCRRAVECYLAEGKTLAAADTLVNVGSWVEFIQGFFETALERLDEAVRLVGGQAGVSFEAWRLTAMAASLLFLFRIEECRAAAQKALTLAQHMNSVLLMAMNHRTLGMAWQVGTGADADLARHHVEKALSLAEEVQDVHTLVTAAYVLLRLEHRSGNSKGIARALQLCRTYADQYGDHWLAAHTLANMGLVLATTAPSEAKTLFRRALDIAVDLGDRYGEALAQLGLAFVEQDNPQQLARHWPSVVEGVDHYGDGLLLGDFRAEMAQLVAAARRGGLAAERVAPLAGPDPTGIEIRTLGGFTVTVGGVQVEASAWKGTRSRDLLKVLTCHFRQSAPKHQVLEALWGHLPSRAAENNLHKTLSHLRRVLDPEGKAPRNRWVILERNTLRLAPDVWVDAWAFSSRVQEARRMEVSGNHQGAYEKWLAAEQLWHGDFLPEDLYAEWAAPTRLHLQKQRIWVLESLAHAATTAGDDATACLYLKRILTTDPVHEPAHRDLIACLYRLGRLAEARRQYLRCRRVLRRELGVEPAPETQALVHRLFGTHERYTNRDTNREQGSG